VGVPVVGINGDIVVVVAVVVVVVVVVGVVVEVVVVFYLLLSFCVCGLKVVDSCILVIEDWDYYV